MDANQLMYYLRGFFELVDAPSMDQMRAIRNEVLRSTPVQAEIIPVEVVTNMKQVSSRGGDCGGGCGGGAQPSAGTLHH